MERYPEKAFKIFLVAPRKNINVIYFAVNSKGIQRYNLYRWLRVI